MLVNLNCVFNICISCCKDFIAHRVKSITAVNSCLGVCSVKRDVDKMRFHRTSLLICSSHSLASWSTHRFLPYKYSNSFTSGISNSSQSHSNQYNQTNFHTSTILMRQMEILFCVNALCISQLAFLVLAAVLHCWGFFLDTETKQVSVVLVFEGDQSGLQRLWHLG